MQKKTVVGLLGQAGSGKSTAARLLRDFYGAEILSIARPVKLMAQAIFGFTDEQVFGDAKAKETVDPRWGITPRKALQDLAMAGRKHLGEDVWIRPVLNYVKQPSTESTLFAIEDMRFEIEASLVMGLWNASVVTPDISFTGHVLRLTCEDSISTDDGTHATESEVSQVPAELITEDILSHVTPDSAHLKHQIMGALERLDIARVA